MASMDFNPLWISLKVSLLATALSALIGIVMAWRSLKAKSSVKHYIAESAILLPMVLPPTVTGYLLLIGFGQQSPVGQLLGLFGIHVIFSWQAAVLAAFIVSVPLVYKGAKASLEQLDPSLAESARVLGATELQILWFILLPASRRGIGAAVALGFARALGEFGATMMVSGAIAGKTLTIPMALYFAAVNGEHGEALLWTAILFTLAMLMLWVSEWPFKNMLKK